jgi:tRNA A-37 threonylcarbamoyl transferase component Bud32
MPVSQLSLEQSLRDLPKIGTLVKDRQYRQVWRFEQEGKAFYLKFYPKGGARDEFRRFFRGSPAVSEFTRLQWLQKANIPAPRAVAVMMGFKIEDRVGDAVILEGIEPSVQLDQILIEAELRGQAVPNHLELAEQVISIVRDLGKAKLGHEDLHPGNFLLHENKLYLLDGYAVRAGGLRMRDLLMLAHSTRRFATTNDLIRGWDALTAGGLPPAGNSVSEMLWKRFIQSTTRENRYFGKLTSQGWAGVYYKQTKYGYRWSQVSRMEIHHEDWAREWPILLVRIQRDQLPVLKRSRSGDVLLAQVTLAGQAINVIVKRPKRRYWYRYLNEIGRGSRPYRAWKKSWNLIARGLPTAWPILFMEKRSAGYVVDAILISEQIPGDTLAHVDLNALATPQRELLLRRTGHILRSIEKYGFSHFDAKASNWIVRDDDKKGPMPVLIDVDGIRHRQWIALGIQRLLRSMHENPHYTPADSLALCQGYAPFARSGEIGPEDDGGSGVDLKIVES